MDHADVSSPRGHTPYAAAYSQGRRSLVAGAAAKRMLLQRRRPLPLLRVLLVLAALAAAVGAGTHARRRRVAAAADAAVRYLCVIDSGSSGTRIYAYNLTAAGTSLGRKNRRGSSSSSTPWPLLQAIPPSAAAHLVPKHAARGMYSRVETRPGLDAFAQPAAALQATAAAAAADGSAANASLAGALQPLLDWAAAVVPRSHHARTPLFLLGTGGLRRLAPEQREALLQQTRQLLGRSGFRFEPSFARVISGDDEGAFGWLALNYLQGRLRRPPAPTAGAGMPAAKAAKAAASSAAQQPRTTTITSLGALDLGGSSLQITFEVHHMDDNSSSSSSGLAVQQQQQQPDHNVTVAGHTFHLHLHSFKGFGLNDAFDRAVTLLLEQQQAGAAAAQATDAAALLLPAAAAGANGTKPGVVEGSSSSGAVTGTHTVEAAVQHDLAVARAAGVIGPGDDALAAATTSAVDAAAGAAGAAVGADAGMGQAAAAAAGGGAGSGSVDASLERLAEQQAADLAAAAAAVGVQQPTASSSNMSTSQDRAASGSTAAAAAVALNDAALQQAAAGSSSGSESAVTAAAAEPDILHSRGRRQQLLAARSSDSLGNGLRRRRQLQQQLSQLLEEQQQQELHLSSSSRLHQLLQEALGVDDGVSPASSSRALSGDAVEVPLAVDARGGTANGGSVLQQQPAALEAGAAAGGVPALPVVHHPCLHSGYEAPYDRVAYEGVAPQPAQVLLRGAPDWQACLQLIDRVVNKSAPCAVSEHRPACVLGTPQPELHGSFVALTGFYVVSKFLGAASGGTAAAAGAPTTTPGGLEQLLTASQALCARPWPEVQAQLGSHINVERYCTWGLYVVRLLLHGLGLEERQVLFTSDGGLGWPLGAALVEADNLGSFESSGGSSRASSGHSSLRGAAGAVHTPAAGGSSPAAAAASSSSLHGTTTNQQQQHRTHHRRRRSWVHHQLRLKATGSRHSSSSRAAHLGMWLLALLSLWLVAVAVCCTSGSKGARGWGLTASTSHSSLLPLHGAGPGGGGGGGAVIGAMAGQLFHNQHHRGSFKK